MPPFAGSGRVIWTVGHSTRSFDDFVGLLGEHGIRLLVDVRHYPMSQRAPWTKKDTLAAVLRGRGLSYEHFEDLGGFRKPIPESENRGWRNEGFRGYADYMVSPVFVAALDRLIANAETKRTAIMCAEAVPWKCHRSLISDALLVHGLRVIHILSPGRIEEHHLTPFAEVHGSRVTYPASQKVA